MVVTVDREAAEVERAVVIAKARLLVDQMAAYMELMGEWAVEGDDD